MEFELNNILFIQLIFAICSIIGYNIFLLFNKYYNREASYFINFDIFGIPKEKAKYHEEQFPYIEENINKKKINYINSINNKNDIIVGIDFGAINSGFAYVINNDITNINIENKKPSEFGLSIKTQKGIFYSLESSISMMNYRKNELNNIIYIKGIKSILYPNNKNIINDNIFFIYPKNVINNINIMSILKEYFIMLKKDILNKINNNPNEIIKDNKKEIKILWVLSIPSIWQEFEKQLIKDVLIQSGMNNYKLIYESDAGSLSFINNDAIQEKFKKKNQFFMLIDAGGYSIDISVKKIFDQKGNFKEIINSSINNCGIYNINEEIIKIFESFFGKSYIDIIKNKEPGEWIRTLKDINKAIESTYCLDGEELFDVNAHFKNINKKIPNVALYQNKYKIKYDGYSLLIPANFIGDIIFNNIKLILLNIEEIIKQLNTKEIKLENIIITGGFSKNHIFLKEIENYFKKSKINIEFLTYQTAISKGSVLFGIFNDITQIRISPLTIGINKNGKIEILIKKNEEIKNTITIVKYLRPKFKNQNYIQVNIYATNEDLKNNDDLENYFFGRLLLKLDNEKQTIIQLIIMYDICLNFYASNYKNGKEIEIQFQYFK